MTNNHDIRGGIYQGGDRESGKHGGEAMKPRRRWRRSGGGADDDDGSNLSNENILNEDKGNVHHWTLYSEKYIACEATI